MHRPHGLRRLWHKWPTFAFTSESGYTLAFRRKIAHKGTHGETGAFWMGAVSLPSDRFARSGNPAWPGGRTANFAPFGSRSRVLPKNVESLRDSDALMRVAVPRRRSPAGLRDLPFLSKFMALRPALRAFYACEVGVVSLPPARAAYCRRSRRPLVKAAYLPFSEVGWAPLPVRYFF